MKLSSSLNAKEVIALRAKIAVYEEREAEAEAIMRDFKLIMAQHHSVVAAMRQALLFTLDYIDHGAKTPECRCGACGDCQDAVRCAEGMRHARETSGLLEKEWKAEWEGVDWNDDEENAHGTN